MKRIISTIMALSLLACLLSSCSGGSQSSTSSQASDISSVLSGDGSTVSGDLSASGAENSGTSSVLTTSGDISSDITSSEFAPDNSTSDVVSSGSSSGSSSDTPVVNDGYIIKPETSSANLYYRNNRLPAKYIPVYDKLMNAVASCKMTVSLDFDLTEDEVSFLGGLITLDHPEFFHIYQQDQNGAFHMNPSNPREVFVYYEYKLSDNDPSPDIERIKSIYSQINSTIAVPLAEAAKYKSNYDRVNYLYYWVIDHCEVNWTAHNAHPHSSIEELFIQNRGVCIGFAQGLTFLYRKAGITALTGVGINSSNVTHTWAIVLLDNKYYACDGYFGSEKRINIEHSSAEFLLMSSYDKEIEMQVTPYNSVKGPELG